MTRFCFAAQRYSESSDDNYSVTSRLLAFSKEDALVDTSFDDKKRLGLPHLNKKAEAVHALVHVAQQP